MMTETSLVWAVVSMIVADSSRMTPMKMKHHAVTTLVRKRGAVICHSDCSRVAPKMLVAGRKLDGEKGEKQDPDRAVKDDRRARIGEEEADAENDAGDRHRGGREEADDL